MNDYSIEQPTAGVEVTPAPRGVTADMMISRQAQEVQAAIVIAKKFPRNYVESANRVVEACKRKFLAEKAIYNYPRGGERVEGPTIRLAEAIAQNWGNIDFGITELEQHDGESLVMSYAWDLETNTRETKIFTVKHWRDSKKGGYKLTDQRDIYELVANYGARRLRACILGVIPGDVVELAINQCNRTMTSGAGDIPLVDNIRSVAATFKNEFGVTLQQLEKYIGWKSESFTMLDLIKLKKVYNSLKDGMAKKEEIFDMSIKEDVVDALAVEEKPEPAPKATAKVARKQQPKQAAPAPVQKTEPEPVFEMPEDVDDSELPFM